MLSDKHLYSSFCNMLATRLYTKYKEMSFKVVRCLTKYDLRCVSSSNQLFLCRHNSSLNLWNQDINTEIKLKIEQHWSKQILSTNENILRKKSYYVLPMFPYPSGNLHMGHVRVYSISDTIARFHKLLGFNAIHPIGWDAFGLPAENAAIERNIAPDVWTKNNISSMRKQLLQLGFDFDWDREISTCDPEYYKWTQFIFLKLFEKGLVYQTMAQVNWDPVDKTVLADEQVDELGCSWRSGAKVEKKYLTQWFIKTTQFAKQLYDGLNSSDLENWKDIINLQKHWIGDCNGVVVQFTLENNVRFDVWTDQPYKFIHGDFLLINRQNSLIHKLGDFNDKELVAYNPITNSEMLIYIDDDFEYPEGRDIYLGCSSMCDKDKAIATSLQINTENKKSINIADENRRAVDIAQQKNVGGYLVSSKLKDWLISRQRYWGTPIPIIHCENCGVVPVPYTDLPVKLPVGSFNDSGIQILSNLKEWVNCKCPKCDSDAKRETDTMDTFVDSSWYYYRFLDPKNNSEPFSLKNVSNCTPVDIYIGGKEHAVLHLYYARFMSHFLHTLGWTPKTEPFKKLVVQGMVMGQSYKVQSSGKYIPMEKVEKIGKQYKVKDSGELVTVQWEKMSKSKYNGENPERLLSTLGCDTTRLLILADVPPSTPRRWSDATLPGVLNWQHRIWLTMRDFLKYRNDSSIKNDLNKSNFNEFELKLKESRNYITATTTFHFKYTQKLSVGISRLQTLTNTLRNNVPSEVIAKSKEFELALAALIIMLSPVTPHFCSELWAGLLSAPNKLSEHNKFIDWDKPVLSQKWPTVDDEYELSYQCKVDGADRCELKIKASDLNNLDQEKALKLMLKQEQIQKRIKSGILRTNYESYPDCRAILHIYTNRNLKPIEEVEKTS